MRIAICFVELRQNGGKPQQYMQIMGNLIVYSICISPLFLKSVKFCFNFLIGGSHQLNLNFFVVFFTNPFNLENQYTGNKAIALVVKL